MAARRSSRDGASITERTLERASLKAREALQQLSWSLLSLASPAILYSHRAPPLALSLGTKTFTIEIKNQMSRCISIIIVGSLLHQHWQLRNVCKYRYSSCHKIHG